MMINIPNKDMNWNLPDPIILSTESCRSLKKIMSLFHRIRTFHIKEWEKITLYRTPMIIENNTPLLTLPTEHYIPEMILTTDGLTIDQQRKTFKHVYKMKVQYDTILLEHLLHAIGTLIYHKHNIFVGHMEIFNKAYKRYHLLDDSMELPQSVYGTLKIQ